jgi:hypothetical protein
MMARGLLRSAWTPWLGWLAGPGAWVVHHQGGADSVYFDCRLGPATVVLGIACVLLSIGGGLLSWAGRRGPEDEPKPRNRRFIAGAGLGMGLLFAVALGFQTLAGVIIPSCAR